MAKKEKAQVLGLHASRNPGEAKRPRPIASGPEVVQLPRWISVSGLECGAEHPDFCDDDRGELGEDYFLNRRATFELLSNVGYECFRIPFRWERLQPELGGALDPDGVQQLRFVLGVAESLERKVVLSMQNSGDYTTRVDGAPTACALDKKVGGAVRVSTGDLAEFWSRMSYALSGLPSLAGYGLMTGPHDLAKGTWVRASNAAVEAIRLENDLTPVFVAGNGRSRASAWATQNPGEPWIEDPLDRVIYEAHCYLDDDESGQYRMSFDEELKADSKLKERSQKRLKPFVKWLEAGGAKGALTEFGVPCDDHRWVSLLPGMLQVLEQSSVQPVWWAAGEHLQDHPLSLQLSEEDHRVKLAQAELFRDIGSQTA